MLALLGLSAWVVVAVPEAPPEEEPREEARAADGPSGVAEAPPAPVSRTVLESGEPEAAGSPSLPGLAVRLVDEHTGEPLPEFRLGLRPLRDREAELEWHVTDGEGLFRSETEWGGEGPFVRLVDVEGAPWYGASSFAVVRRARDAADAVHELAIESGPTYRLALDLVPGGSLEAALHPSPPDGQGHVLYTPVRGDGPPWVRFRGRWDRLEGSAWLEVRAAGGHLRGVAQVEQLAGVAPDPVRVELRPSASLTGRFFTAEGRPPAEGGLLYLVRAGEDLSWRPDHGGSARRVWRVRGWIDDRSGEFEFVHLEPGEYELIEEVPRELADGALFWTLWAPGYRVAAGDGSAFDAGTQRDGRLVRVAEVRLMRGWGELVLARHAGGGAPLEGVEVLLDGVPAGSTDADGRLLVEAGTPPAHVELRREGFRLVRAHGLDVETGALEEGDVLIQAWLRPAPRVRAAASC